MRSPLLPLTLFASAWLAPAASEADPPRSRKICEIAGYATMPLDARLWSHDGKAIARFTGHVLPLAVSGFGRPRLNIRTGDGHDGVRAEGLVDATAIELATRGRLDVVPAQLWLNPGEAVRVVEEHAHGLRVEADFTSPFVARFSASTSCEGVGLAPQAPERNEPLNEGTAYGVRSPVLVLYGAPAESGGPIAALRPSARFVLWSSQRSRDFLRVRYSGAIGIDAWAKARDLHPLPRAEIYEHQPLPPTLFEPSKLVLEAAADARSVRTSRLVPIRLDPAGPVLGFFEPGTQLKVIATAKSWASVLPLPLEIAPLSGQSFWVSAADLER